MKLFFILFLISLSSFAQTLEQDLEMVFRRNPGLVTQTNPDIFRDEAAKILNDSARTRALYDFYKGDLNTFNSTRMNVINRVRVNPTQELRRVVVSGQSVTGMVAAAIAAQSGHKVSVYDLRMSYTREIQWSSRQSVIDTLSAIDPKLAETYVEEVARNLSRGYSQIDQDGTIKTQPPERMVEGDPRRIPQNAEDMIRGKSVATVQTQVFEELMFKYLSNHPNVTQTKGKIEFGPLNLTTGEHTVIEYEDVTPAGQKEKVYREIRQGNPIAIISEGAGSSNRRALGIESAPVSPARFQVAGIVAMDNGGEIVTHFREEPTGRMVTGSMGTTGSGERWVVGDVDPARITPDATQFGTDVTKPEYITERYRLLEIEFRRIAALNMRVTPESIAAVPVSGAIEGTKLQTFTLQQNISRTAHSGSNVLLLGDAVGNGHWSVGGGLHVGAVSHSERLKTYLTTLNGGGDVRVAAQRYSASVIQDSIDWGENGLYYFYSNLHYREANRAYNEAVSLYMSGKVTSPERALELMLPEGRASSKVLNIKLNCQDIVKRVLGDL